MPPEDWPKPPTYKSNRQAASSVTGAGTWQVDHTVGCPRKFIKPKAGTLYSQAWPLHLARAGGVAEGISKHALPKRYLLQLRASYIRSPHMVTFEDTPNARTTTEVGCRDFSVQSPNCYLKCVVL